MDTRDKATRLRRLLLAKQLYEHALGHSRNGAALDKMIAVHNFHNSIEIVLRSILLEYDIRPVQELKIDFEQMMNEIDTFAAFKDKNQKLPYRRDLRRLNNLRNLVQHDAHEPEASGMEDWRVITHQFLTSSFKEYFDEDFEGLSAVDLVADNRLRKLLVQSASDQDRLDWQGSLCTSKLAFQYASLSLGDLLPQGGFNSPFHVASDLRTGNWEVDSSIRSTLDKIYGRIADAEEFAAILASGVNAADLARYRRAPISVQFTVGGRPHFHKLRDEIVPDEVRWVHNFVTSTIIRWQTAGFDPKVHERCEAGCDSFIQEVEGGQSTG